MKQISLTIDNIFYNEEVKTIQIGDGYEESTLGTFDSLKKQYIKQGEECPICYEPILSRLDAILTNCGHHFHAKCITQHIETTYGYDTCCPLCRQEPICNSDIDVLKEKYDRYESLNGLDKLENFWNSVVLGVKIPHKCYEEVRYKIYNVHNLGCDRNCQKCLQYRKTGNSYVDYSDIDFDTRDIINDIINDTLRD